MPTVPPDLVIPAGIGLPDRLGSLYAQLPASLLGQTAAAAGVGAMFLPVSPGVVWPWLAVMLVMLLGRAVLYRVYRRQPEPTLTDLPRWQWRWLVSTLSCSVLWAVALILLFPLGDEHRRLALFTLAVCLCVGSAAAQPAEALVAAALIGLTALWQVAAVGLDPVSLAAERADRWTIVAMAALVLAGAAGVGHHHRQSFARMLAFKRRSELLAARLAAEKDAAEEARLEAEAATRSRTEFFSAASHDLRQPLHALVLFTESLRQRNTDPALDVTIGSSIESIRALEAMFDKLLDLTSIDSGGIVVELRRFHLRELYARLKLHFEPLAFDKGLALDFHGGRHTLHADPVIVERILRNLVSNAIRYTEDGGVLVSCRPRAGRLLLQVWDTGVGISDEALPRIFDEFYQISASRDPADPPRKGLGLGLAIVRRLADLISAPVSVRSKVGRGTVFSLLLSPVEPDAPVAPVLTPVTWSSPTLQGRQVVVVGADLAGAHSPEAMLKGWGAQVIGFDSPAAALEWATSQARVPDLLIVDQVLPHDRAAVEFVRSIRQVFGIQLPAVVVGDGSDLNVVAAVTSEPGLHLLARPVAPNRLRAIVSFKLGRRPAVC